MLGGQDDGRPIARVAHELGPAASEEETRVRPGQPTGHFRSIRFGQRFQKQKLTANVAESQSQLLLDALLSCLDAPLESGLA